MVCLSSSPIVTQGLMGGRQPLWLLQQKKRELEGHCMSQFRLSNATVTNDPEISTAYSNKGWFPAHVTCPLWISCCTHFSLQVQSWGSIPYLGHAALMAEGRDKRENLKVTIKLLLRMAYLTSSHILLAQESYMVCQVAMECRNINLTQWKEQQIPWI